MNDRLYVNDELIKKSIYPMVRSYYRDEKMLWLPISDSVSLYPKIGTYIHGKNIKRLNYHECDNVFISRAYRPVVGIKCDFLHVIWEHQINEIIDHCKFRQNSAPTKHKGQITKFIKLLLKHQQNPNGKILIVY